MPTSKKVLLMGWDAADWKIITPLLDEGKMPNLEKLVSNGGWAILLPFIQYYHPCCGLHSHW